MRKRNSQRTPGATIPDRAAAASADMFRSIVENTTDLIVQGDAARNRTYVSPSCREMLGFEPAAMLDKDTFDFVHPDDLARAQAVFARIGPAYPVQDLTFRMRRADSSYIWVEGRYRHLPDDDGVLAVIRDITAQKTAELQLAEANAKLQAANAALLALVHVDGLTGLANRRHFDQVLGEAFDRAGSESLPLSLILLDVDHFKAFNDQYGHLEGDDCLRRVSRCVGNAVRRPGDCAARFGGEEFAVLLPGVDAAGSARVAHTICDAVGRLRITHAGSGHGMVTVSAGAAATSPRRSVGEPAGLIRSADIALYEAKAAGRNAVRTMREDESF